MITAAIAATVMGISTPHEVQLVQEKLRIQAKEKKDQSNIHRNFKRLILMNQCHIWY